MDGSVAETKLALSHYLYQQLSLYLFQVYPISSRKTLVDIVKHHLSQHHKNVIIIMTISITIIKISSALFVLLPILFK